jgi:hypothetical protein
MGIASQAFERADARRSLAVALTSLAVASWTACGGADDMSFGGSAGGPGGVTPEAACAKYAAALCDKLDTCTKLLLQIGFGDEATCTERLALGCPSRVRGVGHDDDARPRRSVRRRRGGGEPQRRAGSPGPAGVRGHARNAAGWLALRRRRAMRACVLQEATGELLRGLLDARGRG